MTIYVFRRLLWMAPSLFIVFTLTFLVVHATPGSPWDEREKPLSEAVKANLNKQYHLDDPLPKQYFDYLGNVLHGDLGPSYRSVERSVSEIIAATLPVSVQLGVASLLFAIVVGVPLGALAAVKHNTWIDYTASLVTVTGIATPAFVRVSLLIVVLWNVQPVTFNTNTGRDYTLLLGTVMVFALLIMIVNLLTDISYGYLDPRIRYR